MAPETSKEQPEKPDHVAEEYNAQEYEVKHAPQM